jgi:hypothetical protein
MPRCYDFASMKIQRSVSFVLSRIADEDTWCGPWSEFVGHSGTEIGIAKTSKCAQV